jgi:ABC-2 type transport system permease protein
MRTALAAEARKLTSTRGTYGLALGAVAIVAVAVPSMVADAAVEELAKPLHRQQVLFPVIFTRLFALVLGIRAVTDEFRYGTAIPTFLAIPGRHRVVAAKALVLAAAGLVVTVTAEAVMLALTYGLTRARGVAVNFGIADATALAGAATAGALWAAIGVGVGATVRHQLSAVLVPVVWVMFVEDSLVAAHWPSLAPYLPAQAGMNLALANSWHALWVAGAALGAYALALWAAGTALTRRRDIT